MTRLCEEMKKAVAIGATAQFVAKADLSKEGPVLLVEPSLVHLGRDSNGRWVLEGPVALALTQNPCMAGIMPSVRVPVDPFQVR